MQWSHYTVFCSFKYKWNLRLCWWWSPAVWALVLHWLQTNTVQGLRHASPSLSDALWPHSPATPSSSVHTWLAFDRRSRKSWKIIKQSPNQHVNNYICIRQEIPPVWLSQSWWTDNVPAERARPLCEVMRPHPQNTQACVSPSPQRP